MFNWIIGICMLASIIVLFIAWTRAIRIKDQLTGETVQRDWSLLRILVFVALVAQVALFILVIIGLRPWFAWLGGFFLIYYSVVFYYLVNFFLNALSSSGTTNS